MKYADDYMDYERIGNRSDALALLEEMIRAYKGGYADSCGYNIQDRLESLKDAIERGIT